MFYYGEVDGDCDKEGFGIFLINGGGESGMIFLELCFMWFFVWIWLGDL